LQTANILLWAVVFFALVSMVQYFSEFWSKIDSSIKYRERRRLRIRERRQMILAELRELRRLHRLEHLKRKAADPSTPSVGSVQGPG